VKEIPLDPRALGRPFLNRAGVESLVRGHVSGQRNYTQEIHKLLTIELMLRQLVEQN
jgi:asparagine synthase (glutamine-hydrolysing)